MATPAHVWIYNESGSLIIGGADVIGREGSIEMLSFNHGIHIPFDGNTGRLTSMRVHDNLSFAKEFDKSTPYLYRAAATNEHLQKAVIKWYRINSTGSEEEFMQIILENVRVIGITPVMHNFKDMSHLNANPTESISLAYNSITWKYLDGNIQFTDQWNVRAVA